MVRTKDVTLMFKKAFESFFIIDANEKPAPSFLAAYLIAWFYVHKQVITTFISTTGAFDIRLNASIASITENLYMQVFWWAIAFVIIRFALNNLIYFFRESLDHLTQFTLNKFNMKSFVKTTVHQSALDDLANARGKLHSFHDRAILAEESESKRTNELQTFKNETDTQLQDNQHTIKEKEKEIDRLIKSNDEYATKINDLTDDVHTSSKELHESSSAHDQLKEQHSTLMEDYNSLNGKHNKLIEENTVLYSNHKSLVRDNKELIESYAESKNDLIIVNKNSDNSMALIETLNSKIEQLLNKRNQLSSDLNTSNNFKDNINKQITRWARNTNQAKLMLLGKDEHNLNNHERKLFDKLLNSNVIDQQTLKLKQQGIGDLLTNPPVGLGDLLNKPPAVTAAGLGDFESIRNKTKDDK